VPEAYPPPTEFAIPEAHAASYAVVRPARQRGRPAMIAAVIVAVAVLAAGGYGIHRLTARHTSAGTQAALPSVLPSATAPAGKLPLSDIPVTPAELPGWEVTAPHSGTSASEAASDRKLAACVGVAYTGPSTGPDAESDYRLGPYVISSQAQRMPPAAVAADLAVLRNPKLRGCFLKPARREFAHAVPGARLSSVRLQIETGAHGGPANLAGVISVQVGYKVQGQLRVIYVDSVLIAGHSIESQLTFTGVGAPVDPTIEARLIAAVAGRAAQAE
jgi:hypothetical protein